MRTGAKVKVDRQLLIDKLKKARDTASSEYDKATKKYETDHPKYADKVATSLRKAADKIQTDPDSMFDLVSYSRYSGSITLPIEKVNMPEKPYKNDTDTLDKMISVLELSTELTVMVAVGDDYYKYL